MYACLCCHSNAYLALSFTLLCAALSITVGGSSTLSVNFFGFAFLGSHPSFLSDLKSNGLIPDYADNVDASSMDAVLEICAKYSFGNELRMSQLVTLVKGMLCTVFLF